MALAFDRPWQMMHTPFTPSNGAAVVAHIPLPWVVLALAPVGIACAWKWPA